MAVESVLHSPNDCCTLTCAHRTNGGVLRPRAFLMRRFACCFAAPNLQRESFASIMHAHIFFRIKSKRDRTIFLQKFCRLPLSAPSKLSGCMYACVRCRPLKLEDDTTRHTLETLLEGHHLQCRFDGGLKLSHSEDPRMLSRFSIS